MRRSRAGGKAGERRRAVSERLASLQLGKDLGRLVKLTASAPEVTASCSKSSSFAAQHARSQESSSELVVSLYSTSTPEYSRHNRNAMATPREEALRSNFVLGAVISPFICGMGDAVKGLR